MPLPSKDEKRKDFVARCMGGSKMNEEFPNQSQRFAVCNSIWEKSKSDKLADELSKK